MKKKYGVVIVQKGKIKAIGYNRLIFPKTGNMISIHAEVDAVRKCTRMGNLKDAKLYLVRIDDYGNPIRGTPCPDCLSELQNTQIQIELY